MRVSIEVPVFKGSFLRQCLDSVLDQSSDAWTLSLVWDGGDQQSRQILRDLQHRGDPRINVVFQENRGIAETRKQLSAQSKCEYILPLDDDDVLPPAAVERFLEAAARYPWASLIRARRKFIDVTGTLVEKAPWFPFGPRTYDRGMVVDIFNQAQPYLIRKSAYDRTKGWRGFADFMGAGEDCDIFLQLEEIAHFEFVDEVLYHYRLHESRASDELTSEAAYEMWRRLCDDAISRMGLPLARVNDFPPFSFENVPRSKATLADVDFVVRGSGDAAALSLLGSHVSEHAVHSTPGMEDSCGWQMSGFWRTARPLICFLDSDVVVGEGAYLGSLVHDLETAGADVLEVPVRRAGSPVREAATPGECLLVRREVLLATGGFDDHLAPTALQSLDLCLQARRRGFRCTRHDTSHAVLRGPIEVEWGAREWGALELKWQSYPDLLRTQCHG